MRIDLGMHVMTRDGKDVGKIDKLVAEPAGGRIKSAVVRKGFILTRDVEIPIERFEEASGATARLSCTAADVDDLPAFSEDLYTEAPSDYRSPYGYTPGGLLWPVAPYPVGYPRAPGDDSLYGAEDNPEVQETRRKLDLENAVIDEGSDVRALDGDKIGEVHRMSFDASSGRPTHLVIRKGFLFTEDLELPVSVIESVDDGAVYLSVTKEEAREMARPVGAG